MSGSLGVRSGLQGAVSRWSRMPREDRATCHTNYLPGEILYCTSASAGTGLRGSKPGQTSPSSGADGWMRLDPGAQAARWPWSVGDQAT